AGEKSSALHILRARALSLILLTPIEGVDCMKLCVLAVVVFALCRMASAEEWKPAKSPLMTRWAKDVDIKNVLPEYPRPQMVRKEWRNLNGLWSFGFADAGDDMTKPPTDKTLPAFI